MNPIQTRISKLEVKKWSLSAIADSPELKVHRNTVGMWKRGDRYPRPDTPVIDALDRLLAQEVVPKGKRYVEGVRKRRLNNAQ